jgi:hypothetical protein
LSRLKLGLIKDPNAFVSVIKWERRNSGMSRHSA